MTGADLDAAGRRTASLDMISFGTVFLELVFGHVPELPRPGEEVYTEEFAVSCGGAVSSASAAAPDRRRVRMASSSNTRRNNPRPGGGVPSAGHRVENLSIGLLTHPPKYGLSSCPALQGASPETCRGRSSGETEGRRCGLVVSSGRTERSG